MVHAVFTPQGVKGRCGEHMQCISMLLLARLLEKADQNGRHADQCINIASAPWDPSHAAATHGCTLGLSCVRYVTIRTISVANRSPGVSFSHHRYMDAESALGQRNAAAEMPPFSPMGPSRGSFLTTTIIQGLLHHQLDEYQRSHKPLTQHTHSVTRAGLSAALPTSHPSLNHTPTPHATCLQT